MESKNKSSRKPSPQNIADIERLDQALPILIQPENSALMPNESAQDYGARLEEFRRICEARTVLRWIVVGYFDREEHTVVCHRHAHSVACYFANVADKRGKESASILKNDVLALYRTVTERDPSLKEFLQQQLRVTLNDTRFQNY